MSGMDSEVQKTEKVTGGKTATKRTAPFDKWLSLTLTNIEESVIAVDNRLHILFVNPRAEKLLSCKQKSVLGKPLDSILQLVSAGNGKRQNVSLMDLVESSHQKNGAKTLLVQLDHNSMLPMEVRVAPVKGENGTKNGAMLFLAKGSQNQFRKLFDESPGALIVVENGIVVSHNRQAEDLLKRSKKDLRGHGLLELSPSAQQDGRSSEECLDAVMASSVAGSTQKFRWQFLGGEQQIVPVRAIMKSLRTNTRCLTEILLVEDGEMESLHSVVTPQEQVSQLPELIVDDTGNWTCRNQNGPVCFPEGTSFRESFPSKDAAAMLDEVNGVLLAGKPGSIEYSFMNGTKKRWFTARLTPHDKRSVSWDAKEITLYKDIEQALLSTNHQLCTILETIEFPLYLLDSSLKFIGVYGDWSSLKGFQAKDIIGKEFNEVFSDDVTGLHAQAFRKAFEGGKSTVKWAIETELGKTYFSTSVIPVHNFEDSVENVLGVIQGGYEKRISNEPSVEKETGFKKLVQSMHEFVAEIGLDGRIRFVNRTFAESTGFSAEDLAGTEFASYLHPDDKEPNNEQLRDVIENGVRVRNCEFRFRKQDGSYLNLVGHLDSHTSAEHGITTAALVSFNITERKLIDHEVHMLAHAMMSISEGVCIADLDENIIFINDAFSEMYGYFADDILGKNIKMIQSTNNNEQLLQEIYPTTLRSGWQGELLHVSKDGTEFPVFISKSAMRDEIGRPIALMSVSTNITQRKQYEEELKQARIDAEKANRLKSEFLANMSHEIRTPLNIILGCTNLIEESVQDDLDPEFHGFFTSIDQSGQRLMNTIQKIIDISRFHIEDFPLVPEPVDVVTILMSCISDLEVLAEKKGLSLETNIQNGDIEILVDPYALSQTFVNVIENGIKYTNEGRVRISLVSTPENHVCITVTDTGIGMSERFLPFIFDDFSQEQGGYGRPFEGTGLGLSLTKKFVEASGGRIEVESKKNVGSEFRITFPILRSGVSTERATEEAPVKIQETTVPSVENATVLLVEDDTSTHEFMRIMLGSEFEVRTAPGAAEAIEVLNRSDIDVILMDLSLKGDMDGLQLTRRIRNKAAWSHIPVLVLTAHSFMRDRTRAFEAGCDGFLTKPIRRHELLEAIRKVLSVRREA